MVCEKCKSALPEDALYCEKCGSRVERKPAEKNAEKSEGSLTPESYEPELLTSEPFARKSPASEPFVPESPASETFAQKPPAAETLAPESPVSESFAPEALRPLTTAQCVGILLVFCVPVLNLILMVVWAYAPQGNENRRSLARAGLILCGAAMAIAIIALSVFLILVNTGTITFTGTI